MVVSVSSLVMKVDGGYEVWWQYDTEVLRWFSVLVKGMDGRYAVKRVPGFEAKTIKDARSAYSIFPHCFRFQRSAHRWAKKGI